MTLLVGVFWGAFDPPTKAHLAIIATSLKKLPLKKLILVVNNHSYKTYTYPLKERTSMLLSFLEEEDKKNIEILFQDDNHPVSFPILKKMTQSPLCAIAGSDAYLSWIQHSPPQERLQYDTIAVVPRGDLPFTLMDSNALLLPIDESCKYISSSQTKTLKKNSPLKL